MGHKDKAVRLRVVDLLERISGHEAGRHWWKALSRFEKLAYYRIRREAEAEMRSKMGENGDGPPSNGQSLMTEKRIS